MHLIMMSSIYIVYIVTVVGVLLRCEFELRNYYAIWKESLYSISYIHWTIDELRLILKFNNWFITHNQIYIYGDRPVFGWYMGLFGDAAISYKECCEKVDNDYMAYVLLITAYKPGWYD